MSLASSSRAEDAWRKRLTVPHYQVVEAARYARLAASTVISWQRSGAGQVVAAGRNQQRLNALREFGADATIALDKTDQEVVEEMRAASGAKRFDVIIDYLWGHPTELLLAAMTREDFAVAGSTIRLVQAGERAGPTIKLPAAVLRSSSVTIFGTAGIPPWDVLTEAFQQAVNHAARGELKIDIEHVSLDQIEAAWQREQPARRIVVIP